MAAEQERIPRAKVARQSWARTEHDFHSSFSKDRRRILLMNYLSGKQLDAGRDVVKALEAAYHGNTGGLLYKELREAVMAEGHTKRTIEEALRKLKREFIAKNEAIFAYTKKHHGKHKEPKESSMAGRWVITWSSYSNSHKRFLEEGNAFQKELDKHN